MEGLHLTPDVGLIVFLALQSAGAIWWASRVTTTLSFVSERLEKLTEKEEEVAKLIERIVRLEEGYKRLDERRGH